MGNLVSGPSSRPDPQFVWLWESLTSRGFSLLIALSPLAVTQDLQRPSQIVSTSPSSRVSAWHFSHLFYGQLFHFWLFWSYSTLLKFQDERTEVWCKCRQPDSAAWPPAPSLEHLWTPCVVVTVSQPRSQSCYSAHSCMAIPTDMGVSQLVSVRLWHTESFLNKLALLFGMSLPSCWPLLYELGWCVWSNFLPPCLFSSNICCFSFDSVGPLQETFESLGIATHFVTRLKHTKSSRDKMWETNFYMHVMFS